MSNWPTAFASPSTRVRTGASGLLNVTKSVTPEVMEQVTPRSSQVTPTYGLWSQLGGVTIARLVPRGTTTRVTSVAIVRVVGPETSARLIFPVALGGGPT